MSRSFANTVKTPNTICSTVYAAIYSNQVNVVVVVVGNSTFSTETSGTVRSQHVCCCRESDGLSSGFVKRFDCSL